MSISTTRRLTTAVTVAITTAAALQLAGAAPATAVPGLTIHTSVSTPSSAASKSISVACPAGKRVVGGGGIVDGADGKAWITALRPVSTTSGDRFDVAAVETDNGFVGDWWLRSFAICANPVAGLEIVPATNAPTSTQSQQHAATCPAGKRVLGAGGRVNNPGGQVALHAVGADTVRGNKTTVAGYEDPDGFSGTWSLTSYAICANPVTGLSIVTGTSSWDDSPVKAATATCAAGRSVHAGLYSIGATTGDVVLETVHPRATDVTAVAREEAGNSQDWSVTAIAVCAA